MTSAPIRNPLADHLITPQNAALLLIDYQPAQVASVRSMDQDLLVKNAVSTVRTTKSFGVPVVHSTVNVASGQGQPTIPELAGPLENDKPLGRTTVNSWEDTEFLEAVRATGCRKLIFCALWTEVCMAFTAMDALREGYEVTRWSMRLAEPRSRHTGPALSAWSRPAVSRSAGCRWLATFSATGLVRTPSQPWSRSFSLTASGRSNGRNG